jgi:outer membrane protein TolC
MPNRTFLAAGLLAIAAAAMAALPGSARAQSLSELIERAWQLARGPSLAGAREGAIDARELASRAFFAGAPTVDLSMRRDLPRWAGLPGTESVAERGRNEIEPGLSAPVWLPGQRDAQRQVLERERGLVSASLRAERLRLAGEVREAAWALAIARVEHRLQRARAESARLLEDDVARRVDAGELAPSDRLLAQADRLAADAALGEARARVEAARTALGGLTGIDDAGEIEERPVEAGDPDAHPEVAAAREAAVTARARLALAQATRRDNPTVSLAARFDRDAWGAGYRNTLRVGIAVPLDTEARNAPRLAAAGLELAEAEAALVRRQRQAASEAQQAALAVEAGREALRLHTQRADVARDAQRALERAFRAGERGLPEVLRLRAQAFEAELARERARERLGLAVARFNQAWGVTP